MFSNWFSLFPQRVFCLSPIPCVSPIPEWKWHLRGSSLQSPDRVAKQVVLEGFTKLISVFWLYLHCPLDQPGKRRHPHALTCWNLQGEVQGLRIKAPLGILSWLQLSPISAWQPSPHAPQRSRWDLQAAWAHVESQLLTQITPQDTDTSLGKDCPKTHMLKQSRLGQISKLKRFRSYSGPCLTQSTTLNLQEASPSCLRTTCSGRKHLNFAVQFGRRQMQLPWKLQRQRASRRAWKQKHSTLRKVRGCCMHDKGLPFLLNRSGGEGS